jgi:hypothetical protein
MERPHLYVLDGTTPVPASDLETWGQWFQANNNRIVKQEDVGRYHVSTVFLGIDHNFAMTGPPVLFETMVFGGSGDDEYCDRCSTWDEALVMHEQAVLRAQARSTGEQ